MNESCIELTAPQLASVVTVAYSAEFAIPKRTSLPSILPPDCVVLARWSTPCSKGFPLASAAYAHITAVTNSTAIAAHTAQPCCCEPVIRPSV